ncbi:hypothetical protein F5X99DRAFT_366316 [Biscogniauxia marginata]|nr:hypothetical protein F5X99DRAFT_366316 [Biscogniauxia marginata]
MYEHFHLNCNISSSAALRALPVLLCLSISSSRPLVSPGPSQHCSFPTAASYALSTSRDVVLSCCVHTDKAGQVVKPLASFLASEEDLSAGKRHADIHSVR